MGNNSSNYKREIKPDNINIYTYGKDGKYRIVYSYNNMLIPYSGTINWANDEMSEILAIKKALERVDCENITLYSNCEIAIKHFPNLKIKKIDGIVFENYIKSMLRID